MFIIPPFFSCKHDWKIWFQPKMRIYSLMFQGFWMVHMNFYPGLNSLWEGVTVQMKKPIFNQNGLFFFFFCIYQDYCSKAFSEQKVSFFRLLRWNMTILLPIFYQHFSWYVLPRYHWILNAFNLPSSFVCLVTGH